MIAPTTPPPNPVEERDRESYLRWQKIAIEQLSAVINLFLTFAIAELAFGLKTMMDAKAPFPDAASALFRWAIILTVACIGVGLIANITRTLDFRYTRKAVHARWKKQLVAQDKYHKLEKLMGTCTWWIFLFQTITFAVATTLLARSLWIAYALKI